MKFPCMYVLIHNFGNMIYMSFAFVIMVMTILPISVNKKIGDKNKMLLPRVAWFVCHNL